MNASEREVVVTEPVAWLLVTGHGSAVQLYRPECQIPEAWQPLYTRQQVAALMRGMVPNECPPCELPTSLVVEGHNACRTETLSRIDAWEQENGK